MTLASTSPTDRRVGRHLVRDRGHAAGQGTRQLFCAVIALAIEDAFCTATVAKSNGASCAGNDQREALRFLLDERGEWAEARERICTMAGIDATALRERMLKRKDRTP